MKRHAVPVALALFLVAATAHAGHPVRHHPSFHGHHSHGSHFFFGFYDPFFFPPYYAYPVPYPVYPYPPPPPPPEPPAEEEGEEDTPSDTEAAARASYGLVQLQGVPDGAAVELDGRFWLTANDLDTRWLALPAGEHSVAVRVEEGEAVVRRVDIQAGRTRVVRFGPFPRART